VRIAASSARQVRTLHARAVLTVTGLFGVGKGGHRCVTPQPSLPQEACFDVCFPPPRQYQMLSMAR